MKYRDSVLIVALLLTGCGGKKADEKPAVDASDILPGSASDAMLSYDGLKSQSPLAPKGSVSDKGDKADPAQAGADSSAPQSVANGQSGTNRKPDQPPAAGVEGPSINIGSDAKPGAAE